ncbi:MAG: CBS domain-containing protein [Metallosphaera yellowstonensis]|jgi:CBS domain-containing protein|uniref:Putative signal-transduction protein containing cAMP-binding and CBS domains n=1 Tax=Metallosphaera yellowstonensis MK1 TaxID=671065 RepID=H2C2L6_9CREN|nr:CBS domain-containing protein [Metallosphaera yellowstonensis]EHP70487.1 putative signal-transduction protein containing cAMP-binding and CBS domains [Metallosphaera yellowstonensis MK1]
MILKELIMRDPVTVEPEISIRDAARIMKREGVGSLLVVEGGEPKGLVTERDIVYAIASDVSLDSEVENIMSTNLVTAESTTEVSEAAMLMAGRKIRHLVVTEGGKVVGVISLRDVARVLGLITSDLSIW